jgi:UPF0042 nucleotide-binding protein
VTDYVLMTGMSGAGRSTAAAALEDAGWYVIDNMPPSLIDAVSDAVGELAGRGQDRVALVIGRSGGGKAEEALDAAESLRAKGGRVRVVYLDAPDHVLVRRFEGTRRRHPAGAVKVEEAVSEERKRLGVLRDTADLVLDTGELNVNQLRARIMELFGPSGGDGAMHVSISSFGYKHGIPLDADLVFDCRFLPNPYWVEELRALSGLDEPVRAFVLGSEPAESFLGALVSLLDLLVPGYEREGKTYLNIALGCTGGRHRSVVMACELQRRLALRVRPGEQREEDPLAAASGQLMRPMVFHRDVDR